MSDAIIFCFFVFRCTVSFSYFISFLPFSYVPRFHYLMHVSLLIHLFTRWHIYCQSCGRFFFDDNGIKCSVVWLLYVVRRDGLVEE